MPLFDRIVRDPARGDRAEARLEAAHMWLLDEHRLKTGQAIWPGTGYIELIAEAVKELRSEGPFEIEDLTFLRPLHVPDDEARTVRVSFMQDKGIDRIAIESEIATASGTGLVRHAEATIRFGAVPVPPKLEIERTRAGCEVKRTADSSRALRSAQADHLNFGPRWQVLREIALARNEAIARLELGDDFKADLGEGILVHPALLDIATGYAMDLIPGYDSANGLWVPMSYARIRIHHPLAANVWSRVRLDRTNGLGPGYATFDVTIADTDGRVLIEVENFTVKQLAAGTDFSASLAAGQTDATLVAAGKDQASQELSPALARLAAQVDQGITAEEGTEALLRALATGKPEVIVSSMDLLRLRRAAAATAVAAAPGVSAAFDRPDLGVEFVEPATEIEKTLAGFWTELLGIRQIGINDSFFDLGGHSLIAVRLFRMIKKAYAVDFPISVLFEAPTIAGCAALIEKTGVKPAETAGGDAAASAPAVAAPSLVHLVRMASSKQAGRTPFFICAGMFGNILNLRHIAVQIGADRPVYGLQARGIYGGQAPHETFEEMARANIAEMRTVQPHGPYLIGGFSGGGLIAYEMAQQLRAEGEETALVVLLDTPYPADPVLSIVDRLMMKAQDFRREGAAFAVNWVKNRIAWEQRRRKARQGIEPRSAEQFHNEEIEAAFRRALGRYRGQAYDGDVFLMRPRHKVTYRVTGGRDLNHERSLIRTDNGWTPFAERLVIQDVPGDHDSMVLEPHVRVLAGHLREALKRAERDVRAPALAMAAE
jgi:thioesterase domain-containing protein/acyl carrier protein